MTLAPIVTFVYNRLDHAEQLFTSLGKCDMASESTLYIFSDGAKNEQGAAKVNAVREYINSDAVKSYFKEVRIIEAEKNKGLARSVISGVQSVIDRYGKVIVIEDDNIVSKQLLKFMNTCLDRYANEKRVWSISGYTFEDNIVGTEEDVFFSGRPNSYLWGTWADRWMCVDWGVASYEKFKINPVRRHKFNRYGNDASGMLDDQMIGNIDSWAIRFHYGCFLRGGFVVMPNKTYSINRGNDGSGTHCKRSGVEDSRILYDELKEYKLPLPYEDARVVKAYNKKTHRRLIYRVYRYLKTALLGVPDKK